MPKEMTFKKTFKPVKAALPKEPEVLFGGSGPSPAGWHAIEAMLHCPKKYQLKHVRGVHKPENSTPDYFSVGSMFHAGRARWFTLRFATDAKAWTSIQQAVEEEKVNAKLPVSADAERRALQLLTLYVEHWSKRPRPTPICAEYLIGPAPLRAGDPFMLHRTARVDDASKYPEAGGKLCIGEAKTTSGSINDVVNEYTLHGQPLLQVVLWKMAPQGEAMHGPLAGVMLDIAKKPYEGKKPDFSRVFLPIDQYALNWFVDNLRVYLRTAAQIDWDSEVPRNISSCTRQYGRARIECEFRELCMHGKSATGGYVLANGKSLLSHKPVAGQEKAPWL